MKILKRILITLILLITLAVIGLIVTGNKHVLKGLANTYLKGKIGPSIDEHKIFYSRTIEKGEALPWEKYPVQKPLSSEQNAYHEKYQSVAYIVLKDGRILTEKYWEDYSENTISNSFSMSKSVVSLLVGIAIDEGKIKSIDESIANYIPELKGTKKEAIAIKNLLEMASGLNFGESYTNPFGFQAKTYYGEDLFENTLEYPLVKTPGTEYIYQGGNSLLLAKVVENAVGVTISEYAEEKVWKKLGAENDALWNIDEENGFEKASCCIYATAKDFARLGQLYLCQGNWNGEQIVSSQWIDQSIKPINLPDPDKKNVDYYGYQWWLYSYKGMDTYSMRGMSGQYVIVVPDKELVIVRLGRNRPEKDNNSERFDFIKYIEMALELAEN